ncbi:hypothetical protein AAX29_00052 [Aliarcobacter thereius]|uniref:Uncharacterized protein n=1 Tax=Aliarcobacter thereius TaxID=544718 RepID=A0A1C0B918_9BACT|nr:hypothetical protein [Aliarcobacter thereius]OCM00062.1 hypothetical protein AAX29_00052 [Aliarcobacter thereius]
MSNYINCKFCKNLNIKDSNYCKNCGHKFGSEDLDREFRAGNLGNKIIIPTGDIGRPVKEPIKTWKVPLEVGTGVSGAVVPSLGKDIND